MDRGPAIPGFRRATTRVGDLALHHWTGGDPTGPPVLLWHGFLATAYAWRAVATRLAADGCSVLVPDMRGYGDSDKPPGTEGYDARALAEEMRALVAGTGFGDGRPVVLAAHDMGAPPALLWAADHPEEVAGLVYIEAPVMLGEPLREVLAYSPETMRTGSMWWWILPLAPDVPERLIVGRERAFLTWFYDGPAGTDAIDEATVEEYLRTFTGVEGVLGALGVYRAAFTSIEQTEPLRGRPVDVPVTALGGEHGLGARVGEALRAVLPHVEAHVLPGAGHFLPEQRPERVAEHIRDMAVRAPA